MSDIGLLDAYDNHLQIKGVSLNTRKQYRSILAAFFQFSDLPPEQIAQVTIAQLRAFVAQVQKRNFAPRTLALYAGTLKSFFRYAVEEGHLQQNLADRLPIPRVPSRLPRVLTPEQVRTLFKVIEKGTSKKDRRNLVIFHLCYVCGLRISEAANLRRENIDLVEGTLRVIGKGDKERLLYLRPKTVQLLTDYVAKEKPADYLFPSRQKGHVGVLILDLQFRAYAEDAGLPKHTTPHALRHSIAVHYLMGGAPITFVQKLLGHANLQTTGIYTRLTDAMAKDIALKTPTAMDRSAEFAKPAKPEELKEAREQYVVASSEWEQWVRVALGASRQKPKATRRRPAKTI